jgi:hypothetical protein
VSAFLVTRRQTIQRHEKNEGKIFAFTLFVT